jgi:carboxyl-terminal processing protease
MKQAFFIITICLSISGIAIAQQDEAEVRSEVQLTIDDLRTFTDVFNQIQSNFVDEIDDHSLLVAGIEGMLSILDPWSVFLDAERSQQLGDSSMGRYAGIGVSLDLRKWRMRVDSVTAGGPAQNAGISAGDLITAVNGKPVRGRKLFESTGALSGEPGTEVEVRFKAPGRASSEVTLVREFIPVASVIAEIMDDGIAYFQISHFHQGTHLELQNFIADLFIEHASPPRGIIIDLRGNGGGVVLPAIEMADGFLEEGMIVYTKGRYQASLLNFQAHPGQWASGVPTAILVDGRTASASEVFTGALKDHDRAIVIGEKTFGKGSIQSIFNLRNGSMLKLTTAHYFTPLGTTIHEIGIEPDIKIASAGFVSGYPLELKNDKLIEAARDHFESRASQ